MAFVFEHSGFQSCRLHLLYPVNVSLQITYVLIKTSINAPPPQFHLILVTAAADCRNPSHLNSCRRRDRVANGLGDGSVPTPETKSHQESRLARCVRETLVDQHSTDRFLTGNTTQMFPYCDLNRRKGRITSRLQPDGKVKPAVKDKTT